MSEPVKRRYDNSRRQAQARATRLKVIQAAERLFTEHGYPATTIEAIAEAADTPLPTLYRLFGSKRALLAAVLDTAFGGDDQPITFAERPEVRAARTEPDPAKMVDAFARIVAELMRRSSAIVHVLATAAQVDPEAAELLAQIRQQRHDGQSRIVAALAATGALDPGLDTAEAADIVYALLSPDVHRILTVERGWPADRYERWIARSLSTLLGPDALFGQMADGLDVVAVRVADERAKIVLVVFRPHPRLVQHLRLQAAGRLEEQRDGLPARRGERQVRLAEAVAGGLRPDPEVRMWRHAVPDRHAVVHDPAPAERCQHRVVERRAGRDVRALNTHVIEHAAHSRRRRMPRRDLSGAGLMSTIDSLARKLNPPPGQRQHRFVSGRCETAAMGTLTDSRPDHLPLTDAELAAARQNVPRHLGTHPFLPGAPSSRSLWVVFIGEWGIWTHAMLPIDDRLDMPDRRHVTRLCEIVGMCLAPSSCHEEEEALVVLRRPGPAVISEADAYIFRLVCEAAAGRDTAPWTFYVTGPDGAKQCFRQQPRTPRAV